MQVACSTSARARTAGCSSHAACRLGGDLNPPGRLQSQAILSQWPIALLLLICPHATMLLVVQDMATVGADIIAYLWIHDLVAESTDECGHWQWPHGPA